MVAAKMKFVYDSDLAKDHCAFGIFYFCCKGSRPFWRIGVSYLVRYYMYAYA